MVPLIADGAPVIFPPASETNKSPLQQEMLDLRRGGTLPAHLLHRLDEVMAKNCTSFNELIALLSRGRERNIDWWVCRPATRNNHVSAFFAQCMQLALVRNLLDEGYRLTVKVDSPDMAKVMNLAAEPRLAVVRSGHWKNGLLQLKAAIGSIASSFFHCAGAALAARLTRSAGRKLPPTPLTVIDTFVFRDSIANGEFLDRYYPGLLDALSEQERESCYYRPVFYRLRHYIPMFRALRRCDARFLFYEDHLQLGDYAFAFGHWWRARRLLDTKAQYAGFEVGPLVDADIREGRFASIVIRALLAYRFHIAARRRGIHIRRILDWYEGLDLNHAVAASINWHCPEIDLIGFRSAGSLYYMSCTPAPHEAACQVVPRTLAVVGTKLADDIRAICPALNIVAAPGMRYRRLLAMQRQPTESESAVLLALPLSPDLARHIILTMDDARRRLAKQPAHWWAKCHPALPRSEVLASLGGSLPKGFAFVEGDFYGWLQRAALVVGVGSSVLMEAVAVGVPTICLAVGNAPTEIPVPGWVDRRLSRVAYDAQETAEAMAEMILAAAFPVDRAWLHEAMLGSTDTSSMRRLVGVGLACETAPDALNP